METRTIYFGTTDGDLLSNYEVARIARVVYDSVIDYRDFEAVRAFAKLCKGITKEIKNPSVKFLIEHGHKVKAMRILRERNPEMSMVEARNFIDELDKEYGPISRLRKETNDDV